MNQYSQHKKHISGNDTNIKSPLKRQKCPNKIGKIADNSIIFLMVVNAVTGSTGIPLNFQSAKKVCCRSMPLTFKQN